MRLLLFPLLWVSHAVSGSLVENHQYRIKDATAYNNARSVVANQALKLLMRADYIETATELVKSVAPNATFRVVDDHYIGSNGLGHVRFRQTTNGLDIDNADFNVNVSNFQFIDEGDSEC